MVSLERRSEVGTKEQVTRIVERLELMLRSWKRKQVLMMPLLVSSAAVDIDSSDDDVGVDDGDEAMHERAKELAGVSLWLPSDLDWETRAVVCNEELVEAETMLRHAEAYEAIEGVRSSVRSIDTIDSHRTVHIRGQEGGTRSSHQRDQYVGKRSYYIDTYNRAREALESVGALRDDGVREYYPPLKLEDTYRDNPMARRAPGSERGESGSLWQPLSIPSLPPSLSRSGVLAPSSSATRRSQGVYKCFLLACRLTELTDISGKAKGVGASTYQSAAGIESSPVNSGTAPSSDTGGWVWKARRRPFGDRVGLPISNGAEDDGWQEESDKVQWFRAEAEFLRWLEQLERKHFEFVRLIRSFQWYIRVWSDRELANSGNVGLSAFASRQVGVYNAMLDDAYRLFEGVADPKLVGDGKTVRSLDHETLVRNCLLLREQLTSEVYVTVAAEL